jgi:predicted nucleic acid-binding protein
MPFVVDASVAASWFLPDERSPEADATYALLSSDFAMVPSLWWYEIRNIFVVNERRGRINPDQTDAALSNLAHLPIELAADHDEQALFDLARRHRLTAYDAAYLELARRLQLRLATLDRALLTAARAEHVTLIGG